MDTNEKQLCDTYIAELNKITQQYQHGHFFVHAQNLISKIKNTAQEKKEASFRSIADMEAFVKPYLEYQKQAKIYFDAVITSPNKSFDFVKKDIFELIELFIIYKQDTYQRNNKNDKPYFSSQSKFEPTILEEFLGFLLYPLILNYPNLRCGAIQAFCEMTFSTKIKYSSDKQKILMLESHQKTKDQDISIYFDTCIGTENVSIPLISIECKTYIDKTMYENSVSTAKRIKNGNANSKFYIVSETYDMNRKLKLNDPIDNIFILKKAKRHDSSNFHADVFCNLYQECYYVMQQQELSINNIEINNISGNLKPLSFT